MEIRKPTQKQLDLYRFITRYQILHDGMSPTLMDIRLHFDWHSDNGAIKQLNALIVKGILTKDGEKHRGLCITTDAKKILAEKWLHQYADISFVAP